MMPLTLLLWLLLEVAAWSGLARWLAPLTTPQALLFAAGAILFTRAAINSFTWYFAARHPGSGKRPTLPRLLFIALADYFAYLLTFLLVIPLERLWMPADRLGGDGRVVLLVHGYGCSRGVWWRLRQRLEAAGCTVASVSLFPPFASIGRLVPQLHERIEAVCQATGARKLTLVGHSMGGLVCRSYLARHGSGRVRGLITLATPNQGTELARFGPGRNAREMEPDSLWLHDMRNEKPGVPTIAFCNPVDNYVMPPANQRLPDAHNVELPPVGHLAMLYDDRISDQIVDACTQGRTHA